MVNWHGLMEVSGQAGQVGIQENLQEGQMITILNSGGEKTAENGTMFLRPMEDEFYVNMTKQNDLHFQFYSHFTFSYHRNKSEISKLTNKQLFWSFC